MGSPVAVSCSIYHVLLTVILLGHGRFDIVQLNNHEIDIPACFLQLLLRSRVRLTAEGFDGVQHGFGNLRRLCSDATTGMYWREKLGSYC